MRRRVFRVLIVGAALGGVAMSGFALMYEDLLLFVLAVQIWGFALGFALWGNQLRLLSDWPLGVIYGAGADHEWKRRKKYAKRAPLEIVPAPLDDRVDERFDDLL